MSALAPRTVAGSREGREVFVADARSVRVRWRVSRAALDGHGGTALRAGEEPELEISATSAAGDLGAVRAVLRWSDGAREVVSPSAAAAVTVIHDGGLVHLRATAGELVLLDATLDAGGVRYARTGLLRELGLGGGRYEVVRDDPQGA